MFLQYIEKMLDTTNSPRHVEEAEAELIDLMGHRNAADFRMMGLIREVEDQLGHYWGVKSMAHWLNWRCGIALGSARERVRVARALPSLPLISQAFECGSLSYSKVRANNLVSLCGKHHRLLHDGFYTVERDELTGEIEFCANDMTRLSQAPDMDIARHNVDAESLSRWLSRQGIRVAANIADSEWR
jgi:hypothetical protein